MNRFTRESVVSDGESSVIVEPLPIPSMRERIIDTAFHIGESVLDLACGIAQPFAEEKTRAMTERDR